MAKNDNLDFTSMFAPPPPAKPQSKPVEKPVVKEQPIIPPVAEEDIGPVEEPKEVTSKKKAGNKNKTKTTQRGDKKVTTLFITADIFEDYSDIMKIKKKSVSNAVEEFMRSEIKKNAELLEVVKSLRENN